MALPHAASGDIVDVRPLGDSIKQGVSATLVKSARLQVFRYVLPKGGVFAEHRVRGDITVQCLEGVIEFTSDDRTQILRAGELVFLSGNVPHALTGIEDASVLVTIVSDKPPQRGSAES